MITSITIENFCGIIGQKSFDFGKKNIIKGRNAVGKSTIKKAIQYVLDCKDENGKEITGIRPHDENGVDIDGLITSVKMTVSIDGAENTLEKRYFQKKNRQGEYTGENDTQYFIDGVRKSTKKDYDEFIQTFLPDSVCINAQEFLGKDTAGRREKLEIFNRHSVEDIIAENPAFEPLKWKLKANTTQDLKRACRERIDGTSGRGGKGRREGLDDNLKRICLDIEFVERSKKDIDIAELELQKKALEEQIAEIEAKETDISKQFEEQDKIASEIASLKKNLGKLQEEADAELDKRRKEIRLQIDKQTEYLREVERGLSKAEWQINECKDEIDKSEAERSRLLSMWQKIQDEQPNKDATVCPTCQRELTPEQQEENLRNFEKNKQNRLEQVNKAGMETKAEIEKAKERLSNIEAGKKEIEKTKESTESRISELKKQLSEVPESAGIDDRDDVKAIKQQIEDEQKALSEDTGATEIRQKLSKEKSELQSQLIEVKLKFKTVDENAKADDRIEELKKQQKQVSQEISTAKSELDLIKQFERRKAELLKQDVNECFEYVQFEMTELQQNGDLKDVCRILVDGESYDRNLNHGSRLLAEIDVCRGFQRKYGTETFILLDDGESVDEDRIPDTESQLIVFRRTDDEELKVEVLES